MLLTVAGLMPVVAAALHLLPFLAVRRLLRGDCRTAAGTTPDPRTVGRVRWAISAAGARAPFKPSCLVQALVADAILRRNGLQPTLRIGVRKHQRTVPLEAHAWVECEGQLAAGGIDGLSDFVELIPARRP
jgi:hypothetical protein